eukprot:Em0012g331a
MEKKAHVRSLSRGSLDSSSDRAPSEPVRFPVGPEQATRAAGQPKVYGSSKSVRSVARGSQKASTDEEGSGTSGDEDATKQQQQLQRPRCSVNTLELSASGRFASSAVRERPENIDHFATLPRRVHGSRDHFATLPRLHPPKTAPPTSEEKHSTEQTAVGEKAMSSDLLSSVVPNSVPSNSTEEKTNTTTITTTTTTTAITSTIWPQDTKFVSLDALESFNKQLQMLADSEVDNEVDFYDKVISGLQEKIDELHDTILKVEHNGQLSVKMAEQRALEAETKLEIMTEKVQKIEQRCVQLSGRCKELETALQKTAILQERDRAISQRSHLPQRVQSAREAEHPPLPRGATARHHMSGTPTGRQAERSPPQALRSDSILPQALRSDSIVPQGELYPNRSLVLDQSPGHGQHSERATYQGQQNDWNPAQSPSTERNPNQAGQTMWNPNLSQNVERNPNQGQMARNPNQGQMVRNPSQYGQTMRSTTQSQVLDRNPSTCNFKQNGVISTETTV